MKKASFVLIFFLVGFIATTLPAIAEDETVSNLTERVNRLEAQVNDDKRGDHWADRITISGAIESEAGFSDNKFDDPAAEDTSESDIVLATVELGLDADIHEHISGHVLLLWEEDDTDPIDMDEGFISFDGKDKLPLYVNVGKLYLPFGNFESHMITDPATLELGETNQTAIQVGHTNNWIDASLAIFNGDVNESGDDDAIDSYAFGIQVNPPEGMLPDIGMTAGLSYISNLADSDGLGEAIADPDGEIESHVAGLSVFVNVSLKETFFVKAEYITALEEFKAGDLNITGGGEIEPSALNIELAYAPLENLEVALRYGRTDDIKGGIEDAGGLPESQYGCAVAYGIFDSATVALEYLKKDYENNDEASTLTAQLAVEF